MLHSKPHALKSLPVTVSVPVEIIRNIEELWRRLEQGESVYSNSTKEELGHCADFSWMLEMEAAVGKLTSLTGDAKQESQFVAGVSL